MTDQQHADDEAAAGRPVLPPPNWLRTWRKRFKGQPWGFVVFRAAYLGRNSNDGDGTSDNADEGWAKLKRDIQRVVELPFSSTISQARERGARLPDDFDAARGAFRLHWVEDPDIFSNNETGGATATLPTAASLRAHYAALQPTLDPGLSWPLFLCASPAAVDSFEKHAAATDESSGFWRAGAPFLLAVAADADPGLEEGHEERAWFKPVFKVAAEALVESLFDVFDMGTPLRRVTRSVRGAGELDGVVEGEVEGEGEGGADGLDDMWWSMHPSPGRMRRRRPELFRGA